MAKLDDSFIDLILSIVLEIEEGKVATYQQIASLAGYEKNARLVGKVLANVNLYGDYPAHRVVNSSGRLVASWPMQKDLLLKENITFKSNGNVDLKLHLWQLDK